MRDHSSTAMSLEWFRFRWKQMRPQTFRSGSSTGSAKVENALVTQLLKNAVLGVALLIPTSMSAEQMPLKPIFITSTSANDDSALMSKFDYIHTAKMVIGELVKETRSQFQDALLLQAGLRIIIPAGQRQGVAEPKILPNDPPVLQQAQTIVRSLFASGREANPSERQFAYSIIFDTSERMGNTNLASSIKSWLKSEGYQPASP